MIEDHSKNKEAEETGHAYDGIREFNYPAPQWWQILFYACIVWGIGYIFYYNLYDGESLRHRLDRQLVEIERSKLAEVKTGPTDADFSALLADPKVIQTGKTTFLSKCTACHGTEGQGVIGPNLTDHFWIHGKGTPGDIYAVVDKGVADKGMPPWGPLLTPDELKSVVAFVTTLSGTHPANPKAPQGTEVKP